MIKLLVVTSSIAILAALLLPVLSKAEESTKDIGCILNMKEIGVAMAPYNLDSHEAYPNDMQGEYEMPFIGSHPQNDIRWQMEVAQPIHCNQPGVVLSLSRR